MAWTLRKYIKEHPAFQWQLVVGRGMMITWTGQASDHQDQAGSAALGGAELLPWLPRQGTLPALNQALPVPFGIVVLANRFDALHIACRFTLVKIHVL